MLPGQPPASPRPMQPQGATGAFSAPVQQAQPIQQSSGPGEYTRLFGAQPAAGMPGAAPVLPAPPPMQYPGMQMPSAQPMQAPQMPGMQMPMQAPAMQPMQAPAQAPAAPKSSGLPLIIFIVVMGLAVLGLILFLLLRK